MSATLSAMRISRWLGLYVATLVLVACGSEPGDAEAEVRAWISAGVDAVAEEARRDLMAMVSPTYADARGNSREEIEKILRLYFLRTDNVALVTHVDEVRIIGDDVAEVVMTVGGAGLSDAALGFSADAYNFELELQKFEDDWQLISARWGELGQELR